MKPILSIISLSTVSAILVPPPTGPYDVAMKVQSVTDSSRPADPFEANGSPKGRRVLFSTFVPVEKGAGGSSCPLATVPYMTPMVAAAYGKQVAQAGLPETLFASFEMQVCDLAKMNPCGGGPKTNKKYPVLLFTPGLAESRLLYGAAARSLASQGYVVVTVDHPFEANFVEYPDGSATAGRNISSTDEPIKTKAMQVRKTNAVCFGSTVQGPVHKLYLLVLTGL